MIPALAFSGLQSEARALLASDNAGNFAPGLIDRARVVLDDKDEIPRTVTTPTYLTDLGVREAEDPREFYSGHRDLFPEDFVTPSQQERPRGELSDIEFGHLLDRLVLLRGDYPTARELAKARLKGGPSVGGLRLRVYVATLLARDEPDVSMELFDSAGNEASGLDQRFVCGLRASAVVLKRANDPLAALSRLDALIRATVNWHSDGLISLSDQMTMTAMANNLRALAHIRLGQPDLAQSAVAEAYGLVTVDGLEVLGKSEALRYRTQITGNAARFAWTRGDEELALRLWRQNAESDDAYSVSETTAGLAYGLYLAKEFEESERQARSAVTLAASASAPRRLRTSRQILAATIGRQGRASEALEVLREAATDPLGLKVA